MPRTGGGTGPFVLNPVYLAVPGTTILATQHNTPLEDIEDTFNIPQPIAYGGTQGASAIEAMDNLFIVGADKASSASIDLDNVTGSFVNITGTTPVTSIALAEGAIRFARAVAALPLTASASLIVNGSTTQAYTCEAGDQMMIIGYAGAIVRIWVTGRNKFIASQFKIADGTDQTKQVQFSASGLPTATTRTLDAPYYSGTLGLVSNIVGYMNGLALTTNVTDPTNDIDMSAGTAVDNTGTSAILLVSAMTKRVDATWVAGTNQGGRFYTTLVNGPIYIYLIRNPTTGVVDWGYSDNSGNPTAGASYPAGFTQYVRIGITIRASGVNGLPGIFGFRGVYEEGSYTPTISSSIGTITSTSGAAGVYQKNGRYVYFKASVSITNNGTGAGFVRIGLPFQADGSFSAFGRETVVSGGQLQGQIDSGTSVVSVAFYTNNYPGATGAFLIIQGFYTTSS